MQNFGKRFPFLEELNAVEICNYPIISVLTLWHHKWISYIEFHNDTCLKEIIVDNLISWLCLSLLAAGFFYANSFSKEGNAFSAASSPDLIISGICLTDAHEKRVLLGLITMSAPASRSLES